jgi:hypothetical protein
MEEEKGLDGFLAQKIREGLRRGAIREQVLAVGWSEDEFDAAYAEALKVSGVPIPEEGSRGRYAKKATTLEVVMNFASFLLLATVAFSLGNLYFEIIDKYFPDTTFNNTISSYATLYGSRVSTDAVHYAIAALIIAFPLLFLTLRLWFRAFRRDEGKVESKLTKWITYLVLLVAAGTVIGDLIGVLFTFLQGELSARFFLKALVILGISGATFGFYFLERRVVQYKQPVSRNVLLSFVGVVGVIIFAGIVLGFLAAGSPQTERMRTLDQTRARNLSSLASCVNSYALDLGALPESLADLEKSSSYRYCSNQKDPETGESYEYRIIAPEKTMGGKRQGEYELCATFALPNDTSTGYSSTIWNEHDAGRSCHTQIAPLEK